MQEDSTTDQAGLMLSIAKADTDVKLWSLKEEDKNQFYQLLQRRLLKGIYLQGWREAISHSIAQRLDGMAVKNPKSIPSTINIYLFNK